MNKIGITGNVFKDIVENSQFGITILQDDKIIYANKSFSIITGYSFDEIKNIDLEELIANIYGESKFEVLAEKERILKSKASSESIFKIKHKDGMEIWLKVASIYIDYEGKPAIQSTYFDVSERKKTEEGLIKTNAILNNLIKTSPLGIVALDKTGKVVIWNPGAEKIFGWKEEEVFGKKVPIIPEEDWKGFYERFNKELSGQFQVNAERYRLKKDGTLIPVRMSTAPLQDSDKKIIGSMAIISDISDEKEAEEILKETQERFNLILEATNDAIWDYDFINNSIWRNKNYEDMFGYEAESISDGIEQAFNKIEENERKNVLTSFLETVKKGEKYWDAEYKLIKKSGESVDVLDRAVILYDNNQNPIRAVGSMIDITDLKKSQQELKAAKEKAELSDKLKSEFLAQVSHEIRTPLNTMLSFSSLIKEEIQDKLDEDLQMSFQLMENSGKRIIRTIELILNLSELQVGTFIIKKEKINLYPILFELKAEYRQQAEEKGLQLHFESFSDEVEVFADEYSVYQIFENLINNAVKYTEKGFIKIDIKKENGSVVTEISDSGIGINKEFLPFIFQPFTQEEQGYTRKFEGNGLGLALVKNYCDLNGAEISVESEKEKGSRFRVNFK